MMRPVLWVFATSLLAGQALADDAQGRIGGMVRSMTTGETLKSVVVSLRSETGDAGVSRAATVGPEGTFLFDGLPAGSYQLSVNKAGYRPLYGSAGRITLGENQQATGLVFGLWPNSAISGRVVDSEGEPVQGARVRAYALQYRQSGPNLAFAGEDRSDDLGEYRVFDLPAGKYLLQVLPPPPNTPAGRFYASTAGTFYPGATAPSQALPLQLNWGHDLEGVDMKLSDSPTYAVAGAVWDATMETPCSRCVVRLVRMDGPLAASLADTTRVSGKGLFMIRGLTPGDYKLIAMRGASGGMVAQRAVTLRNRDRDDVALVVGRRQAVSGEIALEDPPEGIDVTGWRPHLIPLALPDSWPDGKGSVEKNMHFETEDVPSAEYRFEVLNLPAGAYLKALRFGGRELARPELSVPEASGVSGLQAVIAFDGAKVSGTVQSGENRQGPVEARVFLVPGSDPNGYASALAADTGPDGSFQFVSVVPGAYTLYALPAVSPVQIFDPSVQAALRSLARNVNLRPGGNATVELPLAANPAEVQ